jgi:hypothetical protein
MNIGTNWGALSAAPAGFVRMVLTRTTMLVAIGIVVGAGVAIRLNTHAIVCARCDCEVS